jgi:hypothetical protein
MFGRQSSDGRLARAHETDQGEVENGARIAHTGERLKAKG